MVLSLLRLGSKLTVCVSVFLVNSLCFVMFLFLFAKASSDEEGEKSLVWALANADTGEGITDPHQKHRYSKFQSFDLTAQTIKQRFLSWINASNVTQRASV